MIVVVGDWYDSPHAKFFQWQFSTVSGGLACPLHLFVHLPLLPFCWEPVPSSVRLCIKIACPSSKGPWPSLPDTRWGPGWGRAVGCVPSDMDLKVVLLSLLMAESLLFYVEVEFLISSLLLFQSSSIHWLLYLDPQMCLDFPCN